LNIAYRSLQEKKDKNSNLIEGAEKELENYFVGFPELFLILVKQALRRQPLDRMPLGFFVVMKEVIGNLDEIDKAQKVIFYLRHLSQLEAVKLLYAEARFGELLKQEAKSATVADLGEQASKTGD
jgi:hypothetical protein